MYLTLKSSINNWPEMSCSETTFVTWLPITLFGQFARPPQYPSINHSVTQLFSTHPLQLGAKGRTVLLGACSLVGKTKPNHIAWYVLLYYVFKMSHHFRDEWGIEKYGKASWRWQNWSPISKDRWDFFSILYIILLLHLSHWILVVNMSVYVWGL